MKRRVLAFAMALAMMFTSLPANSLTAVAASEFTDGQDPSTQADTGEVSEEQFSSAEDESVEFTDVDPRESGESQNLEEDPGAGTAKNLTQEPGEEADLQPEEKTETPSEKDEGGGAADAPAEDVTDTDVPAEDEPVADVPVDGAADIDAPVEDETDTDTSVKDEAAADEPAEGETDIPGEEAAPGTDGESAYPVLILDQPETVQITEEERVKWYQFTPELSGMYTLKATGSYDTQAALYEDPKGEALRENDDASESDSNFSLAYALEAGKTYYYAIEMCYQFMKGSFEISLTYTGKAVQTAEIISYPQRVYYQELNESISYYGLGLSVTYTDGTTERVDYEYYRPNGLEVTNNVKTTTSDTGDTVYVPGTYTATVTYEKFPLSYEIQVKASLNEMPELLLDETVSKSMPDRYEYYQVKTREAGEYTLSCSGKKSSVGSSMSVSASLLDDKGNSIPTITEEKNYSSYEPMRILLYSLEENTVYYIKNYVDSGASSDAVSSIHFSKVQDLGEEEELTLRESGCWMRAFVPTASGIYDVQKQGVSAGYSIRLVDSEGNTVTQSSDGYYNAGQYIHHTLAALEKGERYYLSNAYGGSGAGCTVSIHGMGGNVLTKGGDSVSLTGTKETMYIYAWPEKSGNYRLELESEGGASFEVNYYHSFCDSGSKEGGKIYYQTRDLLKDYIYRIGVSLAEGAVGTLRMIELPEVRELQVNSMPEKEIYTEGELFDTSLAGFSLRAVYEDDTEEVLSYNQTSEKTGASVRGGGMDSSFSRPGKHTCTVSYMGQSVTFSVDVVGTDTEDMVDLTGGTPVDGTAERSTLLKYKFTPEADGYYEITSFCSYDNSYYGYGALSINVMDSQWKELDNTYTHSAWDGNAKGYRFLRRVYLEAEVPYYLCGIVSGDASYTVEAAPMKVEDFEPGESYTMDFTYAGQDVWYRFTPKTSGIYRAAATGNLYVSLELYKEVLGSRIAYANGGNFSWSYLMGAGETYYYRFRSSGSIGKKDVSFTCTTPPFTELEAGKVYTADISNRGEEVWYCFTPETTGRYVIYSQEASSRTCVALYHGNTSSSVAFSDSYSGEGYNFLLGYQLTAGETYFYKTSFSDSYSTGSYEVCLKAAPVTKTVSLKSAPEQTYCEGQGTSLKYGELSLEITYEDGTTEILSYGRKSQMTGEKITVTEPGGMRENGLLKAGNHTLSAVYDGISAEFEVTVKSRKELDVFDGDLSGQAQGSYIKHLQFTVEEDGVYLLQTKQTSAYLYAEVYDEAGSSVSGKMGDSNSGGSQYYRSRALKLKAGESYLLELTADIPAEASAGYQVVLEPSEVLSPGVPMEGTWNNYYRLYSLEITEPGYYTFISGTPSTAGYIYTNLYRDRNWNSLSYTNSSSYSSEHYYYEGYTYLEKGRYYLMAKSFSSGMAYTLTASKVSGKLQTGDGKEGEIPPGFSLFSFTPPMSGSYTFSSKVTGRYSYSDKAQILVYDKRNSMGTGGGNDTYTGNNVYEVTYSRGAVLTEGKEYLIQLSNPYDNYYVGQEYTLKAEQAKEVASLELIAKPKQVYYYKLDKLTKDTDLKSGTSIRVVYTDNKTEETLDDSGVSAVSGQSYTLKLPEEARYSAAGYVLAGTWDAQLTYLDKTVSVPIQVKAVSAMPSVEFDESGQGSYSGPTEGEDGSGYIRFLAPEDGFYNLTLGSDADSSIRYSDILNGAYQGYSYKTQEASSETRRMVNATVYVRGGQSCYVKYKRDGEGGVSLSVERASDKVITELAPGKAEMVSIEKSGDAKWFSFTPATSGTYYFNGLDADYDIYAGLYSSPDEASSLTAIYSYYSSYGGTNGDDIRLSYDLTAGKTYYYKTNYDSLYYTGTYRVVLVKKAAAKSLELLTEGQLYCSSLPGYVVNSFANLEFRITYDDDTTETMTFGYQGGTKRNYSLQGKGISLETPSFSTSDGTPIEDGVYTVYFKYDSVRYEANNVMVCAISGLDEADGSFDKEIPGGKYSYYKYTPAASGYYRVTASGASSDPSLVMFDNYMREMEEQYRNSYDEAASYHQVRVYYLEEKGEYCLRLGNNSSAAMKVGCTISKLSPAVSIKVSAYPQKEYYLGVDRAFDPEGLALVVTYEDETTETLAYGETSSSTGLQLSVKLGDNSGDNLYLGSNGTKTVQVSYMGVTTSFTVSVKAAEDVMEMTDGQAANGTIDTVRDYAYVKYTAQKSGFYDFTLTGNEGAVPCISYIKNASYTEISSYNYAYAGQSYDSSLTAAGEKSTRHNLVYLLAGKTYFMKGYLMKNGSAASGAYQASVQLLDDLRDASASGTLEGRKAAAYQFTPWADGYYRFAMRGSGDGAIRVYNSSFHPLNASYGEEGGRKYAAAKLREGNIYFVTCINQTTSEMVYSAQAEKRPEVSSISISQEPEKQDYYAQFENSIHEDGLVITIHYADKSTEELAYGKTSEWGLSFELDTSGLVKEENGMLAVGSQSVGVTYLDQRTEFTIEVKDFDLTSAQEILTDQWEDVKISKGNSAFYVFKPEKDVEYHYYSKGEDDVVGYIYGSDYKLLASDAGNNDFSLSKTLKAGESYILRVRGLFSKKDVSTRIKVHDTTAWTEVTGISLSEKELILGEIGANKQLTAEVKPEDATHKDKLFWESEDPAVAEADENGKVTAVKEGDTVISAVIEEDGGHRASCKVYVDLTDPVLDGVYPSNNTILGPSANIMWIYSHDNVAVEDVLVEYKEGSQDTYDSIRSDKDEGNGISSVNKAQLPVEKFEHGDTVNVRVTACDKGGRRSESVERTYQIDKKGPSVTNASAAYDTDAKEVKITWTGGMEEDVSGYSIYRKGKGVSDDAYRYLGFTQGYVNKADYSFADGTVENREGTYTYKIVSSDQRGNTNTYILEDIQVTRYNEAPVIRLGCASTMKSDVEYTFDLSGSTDDGSIVKWTVDYGDGTSEADETGQTTYKHTYQLTEEESEKTLTVQVTAEDNEGQAATLEKTIHVVNLEAAAMVTVTVVDNYGLIVRDAPVYVNMGEENQEIIKTDGKGKAEFIALPGFTTVGSYMKGYLPVKKTIQLEKGDTKEVTLVLEEKELVEAKFESHRMTLDEIKAASESGIIDLESSDNHHVVEYKVTLEYSTMKFYYGGDGKVVGVSGGTEGCKYIPCVIDEEIIVILEIPVKASILKEFYEVKMYLLNNASEDFSLLNNHVTLQVPDGLTVMEGEGAASIETEIPEIKGQSQEVVTWILRGDKAGEYELSADYTGILSDFNEAVSATFISPDKIKVYGVSNLELTMEIPDSFTNGEFYYNLIMTNKAEELSNATDMYLPQLTGAGELIQTEYFKWVEDEKGYVKTCLVEVDEMPEVLRAKESITRNYLITDQIRDQLYGKYPDYKSFVFYFKNMWIEEISSYGIKLNVEIKPSGDLKAIYDSYRAQVPKVTKAEATGAVYGYKLGEAYLEAEGQPADNPENYTLSYEWYDTNYDMVAQTAKYEVPEGLSAGEYHYHCVVIAQRKDNKNKAQTQYQDVVLTIGQREVTLTWSGNEEREYDGTYSNVTATAGNLVEGDTCEVRVTGGTEKDAGEHTATAAGLSNNNYKLPEEITCKYTITQRPVTLTWSGNEEREYDGAASNVTATAGNLIKGDTCEVTVDGGDKKDVGPHIATATGLSNKNYKLPEEGKTCTYTITPRPVTLTWSGYEERVYDGKTSNVTATAGNLVGGDTCDVTVTGGTEKDAKEHTARATGLSNKNYKLPEEGKTCTYTITPRPVTLTWSGYEERVYDGKTSNVTATAGNLVEGDTCEVTVDEGDKKDVGQHIATATGLSNNNYELPEEGKTCTYTITPRPVTLTWSGYEERVYDGKTSNVTATAGNLVEGDTCEVTVRGGTERDAGEHTATAKSLSNSNYKLPEETTCTYTITPRPVTLTWSGQETREYDGKASNVTATAGNLVEGDTCEVTAADGDKKDAGEHTATAESLSNSNYKLPEETTCTYTITLRPVTLTWSGQETREYDGKASNVTAAAGNLAEGDTCEVSVTGGTEKDAGEHTATAESLSNSNYQLPEEGTTCAYIIAQKLATLIWSGQEAREYDGKASNVTARVGNLAAGDTCEVTVTGGTEKYVGDYTATALSLGNSNYQLPTEGTTCTYRITQKPVTLIWSGNEDRTYDGTASSVTVAAGGIVEGDQCEIVEVTGGNEVKAGTYTATAKGLKGDDSRNYQLPEATTCTYTIHPKEVTLKWTGNETRTYDGTPSNVKVSAEGLIGGDVCTVTSVTGNKASEAGEHTAKAEGLEGADSSNYRLPENPVCTYIIQPKKVALTWSGNETRTYDGTASSVTAEITTGVLEMDKEACRLSVTGGTEKNAGTYTAKAELNSSNYEISSADTCSYTIQPKEIALSWSGNGERIYDGTASNVTASASGLAQGDSCNVTVTGGTEKNVGTYMVTAVSLDNANYVLPVSPSTSYTIKPKEITLSWSGNGERIYDGTASNVTASASGLAQGDSCNVTVTGGTEKNAGTYMAKATALDNSNYVLPTELTCAYTIKKADQELVVSETSYTGVRRKSLRLKASAAGPITYSTSNKKIANVSSSGKVTFVNYGQAVITVRAEETGNYREAVQEVTIHVVPAKVTSVKAKAGEKTMTLTWKRIKGISGYQIEYSTTKKFTKKTTKTVNVKASAKKYKLRKLKSGRKYYVRISAYKRVSGKKYIGAKSSVRSVKVQ